MFELGTTDHWWEVAKRYPVLSHLSYTLKPLGYANMITLIETFKPKTVLEVGHGAGSFILKMFENDIEMWGLDDEVKDSLVYENDLKRMRDECPNVKFVKGLLGGNVKELPDNYFDMVCSVSVIEHIPEDQLQSAFDETYRILKPNGIVSHSYDVYYNQNTRAVYEAFENSKLKWLKSPETMNVFWEDWLGKFPPETLKLLLGKIVAENPAEVAEKYMWYIERSKRAAPINIFTILTAAIKSINESENNIGNGNEYKSSNLQNENKVKSIDSITRDTFKDFTYSKKSHFDLFLKNKYDEKLFYKKIEPAYCDLKTYQHLLIYSFIKENLKKGSRILQVGNEYSPILNNLKNDYECWNVDGIESLNHIPKNKKGYRWTSEQSGNIYRDLSEDYFDLVFSSFAYGAEMAENEDKYKDIIDDINKVLKWGGYSIFSIVLMWKEPIVWIPSIISNFFKNPNIKNEFVPLFKISIDKDLFVLPEEYYIDNWQSITKLPYAEFGKPLVYNLLWEKEAVM